MKFALLVLMAFSINAQAATKRWEVNQDQDHPYWLHKACWAYVDSANRDASLEVMNDRSREFGRPLIFVLARSSEPILEAQMYFDKNPNGDVFQLLKIARKQGSMKQAFTLPVLEPEEFQEVMVNVTRGDTAHVVLKNENGVVKTLDFSLSKSLVSIRTVVDSCFTRISRPYKDF